MKFRKRIISEINGKNAGQEQTKALAMILYYKAFVGENMKKNAKKGFYCDRIENFSYNKMKSITGLHVNTIKKRIATLKKNGLIHFDKLTLVINSKKIKSSHKRNNYILHERYSIKELENILLSYIIVDCQGKKNFMKNIFDRLHNPKTLKEYKRSRNLVKEKYSLSDSFTENGMSYEYLMEHTGTSRTKLSSLICFAERMNIIRRKRNISEIVNGKESSIMRHLEKKDCLKDYLYNKFGYFVKYFFTLNKVYICNANSYTIVSSI